MDNHFHLIVAGARLGRIIADLKKFTAKEIIEQLQTDQKAWLLNQLAYFKKRHKVKSQHQVWQERYHPVLIMSGYMLIRKMEYIHANPVKRGVVAQPEHWLYSSARNYILTARLLLNWILCRFSLL